jgi:hypothetical protein
MEIIDIDNVEWALSSIPAVPVGDFSVGVIRITYIPQKIPTGTAGFEPKWALTLSIHQTELANAVRLSFVCTQRRIRAEVEHRLKPFVTRVGDVWSRIHNRRLVVSSPRDLSSLKGRMGFSFTISVDPSVSHLATL